MRGIRGRAKTQRAEAFPFQADSLLCNPFADKPRRYRREQDAAAEMSGGDKEIIDAGNAAQERFTVGTAR